MHDQIDLDAVATEVARMRERMAELEAEVVRLRQDAPPAPAVTDEPLGRRAALRRVGVMAAGAVAGGAVLAATTASPAAAVPLTGSGNPGVTAQGLGGDGVSASTNTSGRSGVYATTSTSGAWGVFASHQGGGQALQASAAPTPASGKPVAAVTNDGTGMALKATGDPAVSAHATGGGHALRGVTTGPVAASLTGGGIEAVATGTGTVGVRVEDHDVGLDADRCRLVNLRLRPTVLGPPPGRGGIAAVVGDVVNDGTDLWTCVVAGTPGGWRRLAGSQTAGAMTVLPVPVRVYDTYAAGVPTGVGPKTQMVAGVPRVLDLTVNGSTVPVGATAAVLALHVLGQTSGWASVCAAGVTIPAWFRSLRYDPFGTAGTLLTAADASARIQVETSTAAEIQVDVVGYHR